MIGSSWKLPLKPSLDLFYSEEKVKFSNSQPGLVLPGAFPSLPSSPSIWAPSHSASATLAGWLLILQPRKTRSRLETPAPAAPSAAALLPHTSSWLVSCPPLIFLHVSPFQFYSLSPSLPLPISFLDLLCFLCFRNHYVIYLVLFILYCLSSPSRN